MNLEDYVRLREGELGAQLRPDIPIKNYFKPFYGFEEVRARSESDGASLANIGNRLVRLHTLRGYEEHGNDGGGPLHARRTMYKDGALLILMNYLIDDLKRHEFHIPNLLVLQIIVHREPILPFDGMHEREILRTVENGVNILLF